MIASLVVFSHIALNEQENLLDLMTALSGLTIFEALHSPHSAHSNAVFVDSLTTVDTTSLINTNSIVSPSLSTVVKSLLT